MSSQPSPETSFPLEELSWQITKNASVVSQYLGANNLPQPSFDSDGPSTVVAADAPENVRKALQHLVAASLEMSQLAIGPTGFLPNLATGVRHARLSPQNVLMIKSTITYPAYPGSANTTSSTACP